MIEALSRVVEGLQGRAWVVACFDQYPFSLACALMGLNQVLLSLTDDPSLVLALMDRCAEFTRAYALALAAAGADLLSGGDSPAGLIGPRRYREIALPAEQQLIRDLQAGTALPLSLHICGNSTPLLADMATTGADVLELDYQVDLAEACRILGPGVTVWGNLEPVGLLARGGVDDVRRATAALITTMQRTAHRRFVLSSGCTLAVETPPENLEVLLQTAGEAVL
jgi:uroporphyrinogen-III decarboxylase